MDDAGKLTDADWKKKLTPEQYHVLREKGTEPPFSGTLLYNKDAGMYLCAACGTPLFSSTAKYESDEPGLAGWPSFAEAVSTDKLTVEDDRSLGMHRKEISCKTCGSHLGHVFPDDSSPTGQHFCLNSAALQFLPKNS